jgi:hypothetical protein
MSLLHVAKMEHFGSSLIGTQIPGELVGTMNDPSIVFIYGLPNCIVIENTWPVLMDRSRDDVNKELEPQLDFSNSSNLVFH